MIIAVVDRSKSYMGDAPGRKRVCFRNWTHAIGLDPKLCNYRGGMPVEIAIPQDLEKLAPNRKP